MDLLGTPDGMSTCHVNLLVAIRVGSLWRWHDKAAWVCQVGTGKVAVRTELKTDTQRNIKSHVGSSDLQLVCKIKWSTNIDSRAIETNARLLVGVGSKKPVVYVDIVKDTAKVNSTGEAAEQWGRWVKDIAEYRKKYPLKEGDEGHAKIFKDELGDMANNLECWSNRGDPSSVVIERLIWKIQSFEIY